MIDLEKHGLRPDAAEILAKEMQMIVAADRWKGRRLDATPPEKWHRLRPETQQFWIDTASRILAALEIVQQPEVAKLVADAEARADKAHEKEIAVWSENYEALERRLAALVETERERCIKIAVRHWEGEPEDTIAMAAEMRVGMKPLSDYAKKVAQMKEDFPNGI